MTPQYPRARFFIQAKGRRSDPNRVVDLIVIHITDGHARNALETALYFAKGAEGKLGSAHLVVGQAGDVVQCVKFEEVANHAHKVNKHSVGMEHCARSTSELDKDDPGMPPTEEQYAASAKAAAWLCAAFGLPIDRDHIKGHKEADPDTDHDDCPNGCGWDWNKYMMLIKQEYAALNLPVL